MSRRCSVCRVEKPVTAFYAAKRGRERRRCKACMLKAQRLDYAAYVTRHPKRVLLSGARARAKRYGLEFAIDESDFEIPLVCPVLGLVLEQHKGRRGPTDSSPTLDRIRSDRGYVPGNVIVISWRANRLKNDATPTELKQIAAWFEALVDAQCADLDPGRPFRTAGSSAQR